MTKKNGRLSVGDLNKIVGKPDNVSVVDVGGVEISVERRIPFIMLKTAVEMITDACFDKGTGDYMPENKDFAIRMAVINFYTNITLPQNMEKMYDAVYCGELWDKIVDNADAVQIDILTSAVEERIKAELDLDRKKTREEMQNVYDAFRELQDGVTPLFEGLTEDDMKKFADALEDTSLDESKLMSAYFDAKKRSDGGADGATEEA